ncbi:MULTISPECIES: ParB N-terminal domain-containing protein [Actinomycetes]|uniref:ParB/RepB/Spo0J family partition protein n=1 Tax=Actinomycetes TaxID=1760 RepID=UPI0001B5767A|nr:MULTISPECIES: ParB N-terminal domain-containing protein [Actinomycetes]EFL12696.1 predicted protein [Streptomyces sp. AA4]
MARVKLGTTEDHKLTTTAASDRLIAIPREQLQPNPENPRSSDAEIEETAATLRNHGQLQNLNVMSRRAFLDQKPHLADQVTTARYVVINGCRRLEAAPLADLPALKCAIHDDWTENQIDEAMISENEHRKQLNPLLLGRHLKRMVPRYGSERALAKALGKQPAWVNHRVGLTRLHPDLQKEVEEDRITFKLARECPRLHEKLQPLLAVGDLPIEVARRWLIDLRLKPDEQWQRWMAGPPGFGEARSEPPSPSDSVKDSQSGAEAPEGDDSPQKTSRAKPAITIRIMERSPAQLATALLDQLTADEVDELVTALRSST